jgi:hypothetical protein
MYVHIYTCYVRTYLQLFKHFRRYAVCTERCQSRPCLYSRLCPTSRSCCYNDSLVTSNVAILSLLTPADASALYLKLCSCLPQKKSPCAMASWAVSRWRSLGAALCDQSHFLQNRKSFRHGSISTRGTVRSLTGCPNAKKWEVFVHPMFPSFQNSFAFLGFPDFARSSFL